MTLVGILNSHAGTVDCTDATGLVRFRNPVHEGGAPPRQDEGYGKDHVYVNGTELQEGKYQVQWKLKKNLQTDKTPFYRTLHFSRKIKVSFKDSSEKPIESWMICQNRTYIGPPRP